MTDLVYADPELLVAEWLHGRLGVKTWADPDLPDRWDYTAPLVHLRRAAGGGDTTLTVDDALFEVDVLAALADNARVVAEQVRAELRLHLPGHTFGNGVAVMSVSTFSGPSWSPAAGVRKRSATYRVILHGVIAA